MVELIEQLMAAIAALVALLSLTTAPAPASSPAAQVTVDTRPSTVTAADIRDCYGEGPYPWWIDEPRPAGTYTCDYGDD